MADQYLEDDLARQRVRRKFQDWAWQERRRLIRNWTILLLGLATLGGACMWAVAHWGTP